MRFQRIMSDSDMVAISVPFRLAAAQLNCDSHDWTGCKLRISETRYGLSGMEVRLRAPAERGRPPRRRSMHLFDIAPSRIVLAVLKTATRGLDPKPLSDGAQHHSTSS
jgi:hypothetical protein